MKDDIDKTEKGYETELKTLNRPSIGIDVDYYQQVIDDPDVPEERKRELIEIIGAVVLNFIDIGFGIHPVQLAQKDQDAGLMIEQTPKKEKIEEGL